MTRFQRSRDRRRLDTIKVIIEDVNLNAKPFPIAQGRDSFTWGLIDINLAHGIGDRFPTPKVGEVWWIKRTTGSVWILDHKVDEGRQDPDTPSRFVSKFKWG